MIDKLYLFAPICGQKLSPCLKQNYILLLYFRYVDEFGETDPGFRRGNPMHLNMELYWKLQRVWMYQEIAEEVDLNVLCTCFIQYYISGRLLLRLQSSEYRSRMAPFLNQCV